MKKTFKLHIEGKHPDRLLEAIKHEVRKYVKRERRKTLPAGANYWAFDCRFGATEAAAQEVRLAEIIALMDGVKAANGDAFYVEILARAAQRKPRVHADDPDSDDDLEG
ncbi:DUF6172 family protein [Cellvibrio mixtus]|uniref:DUF6172 family protein n=1 Tax=Cellvibrio mixtus TaxID=39650 RepID=UPI00058790FB|nr:DUF6172 family protein [Cellvibrio mixtus]